MFAPHTPDRLPCLQGMAGCHAMLAVQYTRSMTGLDGQQPSHKIGLVNKPHMHKIIARTNCTWQPSCCALGPLKYHIHRRLGVCLTPDAYFFGTKMMTQRHAS